MKKIIIVPALTLALAGGAAFASSQAFAQTDGQYPLLVQRIAEKFNLNPQDVLTVVKDVRGERHILMEQRMDGRLSQAVSDGKLTEAQKQAILQKHKELADNREQLFDNFKNMTDEERRAAMEKHHQELKAWAEEQGIDLKYLMGPFKVKFMHGDGAGRQAEKFEFSFEEKST